MQVKSIAECSKGSMEHSAILFTCMKLPIVIKIFVLYIFEGPFYTCFTVDHFELYHKYCEEVQIHRYI